VKLQEPQLLLQLGSRLVRHRHHHLLKTLNQNHLPFSGTIELVPLSHPKEQMDQSYSVIPQFPLTIFPHSLSFQALIQLHCRTRLRPRIYPQSPHIFNFWGHNREGSHSPPPYLRYHILRSSRQSTPPRLRHHTLQSRFRHHTLRSRFRRHTHRSRFRRHTHRKNLRQINLRSRFRHYTLRKNLNC